MKIIREHIYEKFTEDSDPIKDLGIGMLLQLKKWMKSVDHPYQDPLQALEVCIVYAKEKNEELISKFIKYLLNVGVDIHYNEDFFIQSACHYGNLKIIETLLDAGANIHALYDKAIYWSNWGLKPNKVKNFLDDYFEIKEKAIKESLNEKFSDESDPIYDMGIGINVPRNFNSRDEMNNWLSEYLPMILRIKNFPENILSDSKEPKYFINVKYSNKLVKYVAKYFSINNEPAVLYPENFHIFLKRKYPHLESWMIRESLNEKFSDESDPVHDMNIGILNIKKTFNTRSEAVDFMIEILPALLKTNKIPGNILHDTGTNQIFGSNYGKKIAEYIYDYISLDEYSRKHDKIISSYIVLTEMIEKLKKMGYPKKRVKESLDEKFTEDSDPIRDMGIGEMNKEVEFNDEKTCVNWIVNHIPAILKMDKIPKDIIKDESKFLNRKYYDIIGDYAEKYLKFEGYFLNLESYSSNDILKRIYYKLRQMGFKDIKGCEYETISRRSGCEINMKDYLDESIKNVNEKFTEEGDPVHDMNIGMGHLMNQWFKEIGMTSDRDIDELLSICARNGKLDFVKYLVERGANVKSYGSDALQQAAANNRIETVKFLLNKGADVKGNNSFGFRWAARCGYNEMVKLLLDAGADIHAGEDYALTMAKLNKHDDIIELLKQYGADDKIVKESLNEKFTEDSDPIHDLGIGLAKIEVHYDLLANPEEIEVELKIGRIFDDVYYTHPEEEGWDKIDKIEVKKLMDSLNVLFKEAGVVQTGEILNKKAIKKIQKILDDRNLTELFGAETYNGWEYEEADYHEGLSHEEAVIAILAYCISKCKVFLDYYENKTIVI